MLLAYGISGFLVNPDGSNRTCENFSTSVSRGTPYCSDIEIDVAKASIRPEIVEPSLAMTRKISPGLPSSYIPTVMYPSWPAIENLWVIDRRVSASLRRSGRASTTGAGATVMAVSLASSLDVLRGWLRLQPSRYTATAFKIGRASCRERVGISVARIAVERAH